MNGKMTPEQRIQRHSIALFHTKRKVVALELELSEARKEARKLRYKLDRAQKAKEKEE